MKQLITMDKVKISNALQDLVMRLKDAQEGFKEVSAHTKNEILKEWTSKISNERYAMHQNLAVFLSAMGKEAEVHTSFLGDTHRLFIQIKANLSWDDTTSLVEEIERGASKLLDDYNTVLQQIQFPNDILTTLMSQKMMIEKELDEFQEYKEKIEALVA